MSTVDTASEIAVIGMAGRFPGATNLTEYWQNLRGGVDSITRLTDAELIAEGVSRKTLENEGYVRAAPTLEGIDLFDAGAFGFTGREATLLDPQQRLFLECAQEAVEHAGLRISTADCAGIYAGCNLPSYWISYLTAAPEISSSSESFQLLIHNEKDYLASRTAHRLGLTGPAVNVQTACSSSLVAVHMACQALLGHECDVALAGAATVRVPHRVGYVYENGLALSPDGRCRPFDAAAAGTVPGNGVGVVVLKRASDAVRDGDTVRAVIKATAVNNDGADKIGFTAPSVLGQTQVIATALELAGIDPETVTAIEGHGTGTHLGDPIEVAALTRAFRAYTTKTGFCALSSVKGNIGHAETAAGIAGLIKAVLQLQHGQLAPTAHFERANPKLELEDSPFYINDRLSDWKPLARSPLRIGVSSFGIGGTNAHAVLEAAPVVREPTVRPRAVLRTRAALVPVSAKSPTALRQLAQRIRHHLGAQPEWEAADVGYSLATGRTPLDQRAALVAADRQELLDGLHALAEGRPLPNLVTGVASVGRRGRTAFLLSGQGGQWPGMGKGLYEASPAFADAFDEICAVLDGHLDRPLREIVFASPGSPEAELLDRTCYTQPAVFALEVALFRMLEGIGVRCDSVAGHSIGEVAAVHVAGALTLEDACTLAAARGRLMESLPAGGAMAAVGADEDDVAESLAGVRDRVGIAAVNAPGAVVVSGDQDAVDGIVRHWQANGRRASRLTVSHAFHSPRMEPILADIRSLAGGLSFRTPRIPLVSTVTGRSVGLEELRSPDYWARQARHTVRLHEAVRTLWEDRHRTFVEIGAHPALTPAVQQTCEGLRPADGSGRDPNGADDVVVTGTLCREQDDVRRLLTTLAHLCTGGTEADWSQLYAGRVSRRVDLPTYPFQRRSHWLRPAVSSPPVADRPDGAETEFWQATERGDITAVASLLEIAADTTVASALPALARWRRDHTDRTTVDRWRYHEVWVPVAGPETVALSGVWLVVAPADPAAQDVITGCAQGLERCGATVRELLLDTTDLTRDRLAERLRDGLGDCRPAGVLSLLGLSEQPHPEHGSLPVGLAGTLALIHGLTRAGVEAPLWCATRQAVSTAPSDSLVHPVQATVWGLGRVAALEYPPYWGGLIDLPERMDDRCGARLGTVLAGHHGEDEVAVRTGGLFARRIVPAPPPEPADTPTEWQPSGSVLVTGGTGELGARIARWLAGRGARHLILASRRGPKAHGAGELRAELAALGAEARIVACDVADRAALAALLADVPAEQPLTAVVHAAGVLDDGVLESVSPHRLAHVLRPKLVGALNLHELTRSLNLSRFVLFSSATASFGSPGQAAYCAANAFLDALARHRRDLRLPATGLAWGLWGGPETPEGEPAVREGMRSRTDTDQLRRHGVTPMDPRLALTAMGRALDRDEADLLIADLGWPRFGEWLTSMRSSHLFDRIPGHSSAADESDGGGRATEWRRRLTAMGAEEQEQAILELVLAHTAAVLGRPDPEGVEVSSAFQELGFSSLNTIELANRLNAAMGIRVPAAVLFEYGSPAALGRHLRMWLLDGVEEPPRSVTEQIDQLEEALSAAAAEGEREVALARLRSLMTRWDSTRLPGGTAIETATAEELFDLIDSQVGAPVDDATPDDVPPPEGGASP
ncbi:SDR family NAD(P)-dependent oxidoreductase [Streptomyces sp. NPDC021093]|uniref:SDR family NAD(P)-dependent oxidoreductase n=1 Tax=Streptomyces sp. NPDC021093 TaxID=3365112 RepID=UPI0037B59DE8